MCERRSSPEATLAMELIGELRVSALRKSTCG